MAIPSASRRTLRPQTSSMAVRCAGNLADEKLFAELKAAFASAADPERAAGQQAYMKSTMPFYGVQMPELRRLSRTVFAANPLASRAAWMQTIELIWWNASHREERHAALELLAARSYKAHHDPELLDLLKALIVSGAWWDFVDTLAINQVGPLLRDHPDEIRPHLLKWSTGEDIWLRRTAILAQLKFKQHTDWPLLKRFIEPSAASGEFFLRKGIGWALREYSKTEPDRVLDYVRANHQTLSGLTKREGLKILLKSGRVAKEDPIFVRH